MKKNTTAALLLLSAFCVTGCASKTPSQPVSKANAAQNEQNRKNTDSSASDEEKADDNIELPGLSAVDGTSIDLSKVDSGLVIEKGGEYTVTGNSKAVLVVDAGSETVTLCLKDASIENSDGPALYIRSAGSVEIVLEGSSSLTSSAHESSDVLNAALYSRVPTKISGSGTLTLNDTTEHGLKCKEDLTLESGTLNITAGQDGIHASDSLIASAPEVTITGGDEGIDANGSIQLKNGTYTISSKGDGIRAEKELEIQDGTYSIQSEDEGLESKEALTISSGTIKIQSTDDCINAANSLTISGGQVRVLSTTNDGIDSNGDLIFSGGTVESVGLKAPEGAFDVDNTPFTISGGTIIGLSATACRPSQIDQNTVMIQTSQSFSKLELKQDGKTLISWTAPESAKTTSAVVTLSCPNLQADQSAELLLDGQSVETFDVTAGLTKVGNIMEMGGGMDDGPRGQMPEMNGEIPEGEMPEFPEGERPEMNGEMPPMMEEGEDRPQPPAQPDDGNGQIQDGQARKKNQKRNNAVSSGEDAQSSATA